MPIESNSSNEPLSPKEILAGFERIFIRALKKLEKKREKQLLELKETAQFAWYRQVGDSLLAAPGKFPRGTTKTMIYNVHTEKEEPITLNPKFDIHANAELFYKKARKGERGEQVNNQKVLETTAEIDNLTKLITQCESATPETLNDALLEQLETEAYKWERPPENRPGKKTTIVTVPYRHITLDSWDIYIGKTDSQNDELTTRFAKPSDIWLHVAGHAGSHVVIRRPKNAPYPPAPIIEKAASLAVWFSKAKHTSFAEVHVTEARFVHKRRHSPPGEVIAERCKAVRVSPINPQDMFSSEYSTD